MEVKSLMHSMLLLLFSYNSFSMTSSKAGYFLPVILVTSHKMADDLFNFCFWRHIMNIRISCKLHHGVITQWPRLSSKVKHNIMINHWINPVIYLTPPYWCQLSHWRHHILCTRAATSNRDIKFSIQIGSDWSKMGQIWDFLTSVSVHIG